MRSVSPKLPHRRRWICAPPKCASSLSPENPAGAFQPRDNVLRASGLVRAVNSFPSALEEILRTCTDVAEYRVHVTQRNALAELKVEIEASPRCRDVRALAAGLEGSFLTTFNLRIPVTVLPAGALPRFEMKAQRWIKD